MQKYLKIIGYGVLVWVVSLAVRYLLGFLNNVDTGSLLIVISTAVACYALIQYFRQTPANIKEAALVGAIWVLVSWLLDWLTTYIKVEGISPLFPALLYLSILVISVTLGALKGGVKSAAKKAPAKKAKKRR